jgi:adenylosuccinate lyase
MMDEVERYGGNRQELHEEIRKMSMQAGRRVKEEGLDNNLLELIEANPKFHVTREEMDKKMDPQLYVGCAPHQVEKYLETVVQPMLDANQEELGVKVEITV